MVINPAVLNPGGIAEIRDIAEKAATQQTAAPQAETANVRQFNQALQEPQAVTDGGQVSAPLQSAAQVSGPTQAPKNLGDRILQNLERASKPVEGQGALRATTQAADNSLSARSTMEAQYKLAAWDLNSQLESKVAGKATQSVQTLLKTQ